MTKIKVCQVLNAYQVGGAETVALDLARSLDPDRFESLAVAVIEPRSEERPEMQRRFDEAGVVAHSLHHRHFRDPRTLWDMVRFFRRHRPHVVHGHNRFSDYWACRTARWARVPVAILTRHLVYRDMRPHQIARYRKLSRDLPRVIAVSDAVRHHCIETEGMAARKVEVIVNGIDTRRFRPLSATERLAKRQELGIGPDTAMLLFVGRLTAQKAPEAFIDLVTNLRRQGRDILGFLCGRGDEAEALAARCARSEGLTMLGLRRDVPALLGACDLFVSTSRNEGLPLNFMEAMAAGAPCLGPDLDQVVQLVGKVPELAAGLFPRPPANGPVPASLIDQWSKLVAANLDDSERRRLCGKLGRAVIEERFSLANMVGAHARLYTELLASHPVVTSSQQA